MRLEEPSAAAYAAFLREAKLRYFYQQSELSVELSLRAGQKVRRLALVDEQGQIRAVAKEFSLPYRRVFYSAEIYYGPILRANEDLKVFLTLWLAERRRDPRCLRLRLAPLIERRIYHDLEAGELCAEGRAAEAALQAVGFRRLALDFDDAPGLQARFHYVKDLQGVNKENLLQALAPRARHDMTRAERLGVQLRFLEASESELFNRLLEQTLKRTGQARFTAHFIEKSDSAWGTCRYLPYAYLRPQETLLRLNEDGLQMEEERALLEQRPASKKRDGRLRELESAYQALQKRQAEMKEMAELAEEIPLAAAEFYKSPSDMIYCQSASDERYQHFAGVYAIQKRMLEIALTEGLRYYNFFAVSNPFREVEKGESQGVLNFKRSFQGDLHEYLGTYEYCLGPAFLHPRQPYEDERRFDCD